MENFICCAVIHSWFSQITSREYSEKRKLLTHWGETKISLPSVGSETKLINVNEEVSKNLNTTTLRYEKS